MLIGMGNYAYMKFIDEKFEFEIEVRALEGLKSFKPLAHKRVKKFHLIN